MRRCAALAAILFALGAAAPAAQADHVNPTVTTTLVMGEKVKDCSGGICGGSRRATVSWNASCGPGVSPDALQEIEVSILGVKPSGKRFVYDSETFDSVDGKLVDSLSVVAGPGLRFVAEVTVTCSMEVVNGEGDLVEHRGKASGTSAELFLAPRLSGYLIERGTVCGYNLSDRQFKRVLQARQYFRLVWYLRFSGASLLKSGMAPRKQVKLFARGAGLSQKTAPDRSLLFGSGDIGNTLTPRRAGTLKIWATIGGYRTNTLRIKVLPRRGC